MLRCVVTIIGLSLVMPIVDITYLIDSVAAVVHLNIMKNHNVFIYFDDNLTQVQGEMVFLLKYYRCLRTLASKLI